MNENETIAVAEESEVIDESVLNSFDEEWSDEAQPEDDSGDTITDESSEGNQDTAGSNEDSTVHEDSNQEKSDSGEQKPDDGEDSHDDAEDNKDDKEGHQLYTLKSPKGERECTLEEVLSFANKGMDYDGVRQDRDRLRSYEKFLMELAEPSGAKTVEELMDITRAGIIISKERESGKEISESEALLRAQRERMASARQEQQSAAEPAKLDFKAFAEEFPDAKATDIPKTVWDEARASGDLSGAYRKHLASQQNEEIRRLRQENELLKQNKTNKERSTGSRRTAGAPTPKDPFDEAWDSF